MWAQDAAAMYGYAGASAAASTLTPFTPPPQVTNAPGLAGQAAAVAQAAGTPAGTGTGTIISATSQLTSAVPNALQELASGAASDPSTSGLSSLLASSPLEYLSLLTPYTASIATTRLGLQAAGLQAAAVSKASATGVATGGIARGSTGLSAGGSGTPATADVGRAASIGGLTVPQSWTAAAPTVRLVDATSPTTSISAAPTIGAGSPDSLLPAMPVASMAGRAMTGTAPRARPEVAVTRIVVRHPSAG
jgi:PPE-repeat protein